MSTDSNLIPSNNDYLALIDAGKFAEALDVIQILLQEVSDDVLLRASVQCLYNLGKFPEAIATLQQLSEPSYKDYFNTAICYWELEDWPNLNRICKVLSKLKPSSFIYYLMAISEAKGKYDFELDAASLNLIIGLLNKSIELGNARVEVYLWLIRLLDHNDISTREALLNKAHNIYPDNTEIVFQLARFYLYVVKEYKQATDLLLPLTTHEETKDQAYWYLFEIAHRGYDLDQALSLLENIEFRYEDDKLRIQSDIYLAQGKVTDWLIAAGQIIRHPLGSALLPFRKTYVNIQANAISDAVSSFFAAFDQLVLEVTYIDCEVNPFMRNYSGQYTESDVVLEICEMFAILDGDSNLIDDQVRGRILYICDHYYGDERANEIKRLFPDLLELDEIGICSLLGNPPVLGNALYRHYIDSDFFKAIDSLLRFWIWAYEKGTTLDATDLLTDEVGEDREFEISSAEERSKLNQLLTAHLKKYTDPEILESLFIPLYQAFWRDLLFEDDLYTTVIEINERALTIEQQDLFDTAYALAYLGQAKAAEDKYIELIAKEPDHASALNNLGVILQHRGDLKQATYYFEQATIKDPNEELYAKNFAIFKQAYHFQETCLSKYTASIEKIRQNSRERGLSLDQQQELHDLYWSSSESTKQIQVKFGLTKLNDILLPLQTDVACPNCGCTLVFINRTARSNNNQICLGCGHDNQRFCRCNHCQKQRERRKRDAEIQLRNQRLLEHEQFKQKYFTTEYATFAITKLYRRDKQFLRALLTVLNDEGELNWEKIREQAGVVSEKRYVQKLLQLKLLLLHPDSQLVFNHAISIDMIPIPKVRSIPDGIRFQVLQNDNHTCRYCGRTPPDVKLVIDHLLPVKLGGTDELNNLITSCEECNSGKSAKLIDAMSNGLSRDEWREVLRTKRREQLNERREHLDELLEFFQQLSIQNKDYRLDADFVHELIEIYEADWIKAAIRIAIRKEIPDLSSYIRGILRNWAKDGAPEYVSGPEKVVPARPATAKQIEYIKLLLDQRNLSLDTFYKKPKFEDLTMDDARELITALKERLK